MMKAVLIGVLAAIVTAALPVHAQQTYIGIGVGQGSVDVEVIPGLININDDSASTFKVFAGFHVTRAFAVEVSYSEADDISRTLSDGINTLTERFEAQSFTAAAVGFANMGRGRLFGKFGLARSSVDNDGTLNGVNLGTLSDTSTEPMFGVGGELDVTGSVAIRAEFERYLSVGGDDTGESDVDVVGASVVFRF